MLAVCCLADTEMDGPDMSSVETLPVRAQSDAENTAKRPRVAVWES